MMELKRRAQALCEHTDMEEDGKLEVQLMVQDVKTRWGTVLQVAEETRR